MESRVIQIKEKSIVSFFRDKIISAEGGRRTEWSRRDEEGSPYSYMCNEVYVKDDGSLFVGDTIIFKLSDRTINTGNGVENEYSYTVHPYDDFSLVMKLNDLKSELNNTICPQ